IMEAEHEAGRIKYARQKRQSLSSSLHYMEVSSLVSLYLVPCHSKHAITRVYPCDEAPRDQIAQDNAQSPSSCPHIQHLISFLRIQLIYEKLGQLLQGKHPRMTPIKLK